MVGFASSQPPWLAPKKMVKTIFPLFVRAIAVLCSRQQSVWRALPAVVKAFVVCDPLLPSSGADVCRVETATVASLLTPIPAQRSHAVAQHSRRSRQTAAAT